MYELIYSVVGWTSGATIENTKTSELLITAINGRSQRAMTCDFHYDIAGGARRVSKRLISISMYNVRV